MDTIYEKSISTWVEDTSKNRTPQQLSVCIYYASQLPGHQKDLNIRVTSSENAFLLFHLKLNNDDFHHLKTQQGLLIDFPSFPSKFIELLGMCENNLDKFELHLQVAQSSAVLQVIEVNAFKHLVHLSLNLVSATDSMVKKYLAECLQDLQNKHKSTTDDFERKECGYVEQIKQLEISLNDSRNNLQGNEKAKVLELSEQKNLMKEQLDKERQASKKYQDELQARSETTAKQLENRIKELETKNKKFFDEKCRFELQNRELIAKVKLYEEERSSDKGELKRIKSEYTEMEKQRQNNMTDLHSTKTQLAVIRQELKEYKNVIGNLEDQLSTANTQKSKLEDQIDTQHDKCVKLEYTVRSVSEEVLKGNDIISKMQAELKGYRSKFKMKHMQTINQEKTLQEVEEERRKLESGMSELKKELEEKARAISELEAGRATMEEQILECNKKLKSNENVISWLNKQMNDKLTLGGPPRSLPSLLRQPLNQNLIIPQRKETAKENQKSFHHLSSFEENGRRDDSLIDESYLKETYVDDTIKSDQILTIGGGKNSSKKVHTQPMRVSSNDPPLLKMYAP